MTLSSGVHRLASSSGELAYHDEGERNAPLIVLQHGFPDYPKTFFPLAERLRARGYRTVLPFLRGYAPSTLDGPFDDARLGLDLVELAEALSPGRPALLVGHDWGAVAVYRAVQLRPEAFMRAVTLAVPHTAAFTRNLRADLAQRWRSAYMAFFMLPFVPDRVVAARDFAFVDLLWRRWSPGHVAPADYMAELKACLSASMPSPLGHYRALASTFVRPRGASRPAKIRVPLLHLHGADDGCISAETSDGEERYFAGEFRREVLAGVGHFLHLEAPERISNRILEFIGDGERVQARSG
ncbi:MAG TPA: alpha/beta fold hydrolase [Polyangiaceae bacterium]|jgi:pimeloyl-ACP methyl ester carboxylesterase|nr:alpha/beta fold hydrolase [Polyangiaceae bacterium]